MKILIVSKNLENFRYVHRIFNLKKEEVIYERDIRKAKRDKKSKYVKGIILDLPKCKDIDMDLDIFLKEFIHRSHQTKTIVLTQEVSTNNRLKLMSYGCEVCITNPASEYLRILVNFSETLGMLYKKNKDHILINAESIFDVKGWNIIRNGKYYPLPKKEYELLYLLASNKGKIITTDEILKSIWDEITDKERVRHYIKKLRRKIGDNGTNPTTIINSPGAGYYLKKM
ncbi:winged helix-turn-helix domain-containing protein [Alteribacillus sp. HJP-4]|uniref:winged helix-turn-helix domain-containing protein n=1 Tax=Alteribacillus sp. HJP-4 TaxID=2775394 RepID=UPI0035CCF86A